MELVFFLICSTLYILFGGYFLKYSIKYYKEGKLFSCGINVMLFVHNCVFLIKDIIEL